MFHFLNFFLWFCCSFFLNSLKCFLSWSWSFSFNIFHFFSFICNNFYDISNKYLHFIWNIPTRATTRTKNWVVNGSFVKFVDTYFLAVHNCHYIVNKHSEVIPSSKCVCVECDFNVWIDLNHNTLCFKL